MLSIAAMVLSLLCPTFRPTPTSSHVMHGCPMSPSPCVDAVSGSDLELTTLASVLTRVLFTLVKVTRRDYCQGINIVTGLLLSVVRGGLIHSLLCRVVCGVWCVLWRAATHEVGCVVCAMCGAVCEVCVCASVFAHFLPL